MEKKHRERGENWTREEKAIFIDIMRDSLHIIECKKTDTNTNKKKQLEWQKVQKKHQEQTGKLRYVAQLKGFWRRIRLVAIKNLLQNKKPVLDDERPTSPTQEVLKIICPNNFITADSNHHSDGNFMKPNHTSQGQPSCIEEIIVGNAYNPELSANRTCPNPEAGSETKNMGTPNMAPPRGRQKGTTSGKQSNNDGNSHQATLVSTNMEFKEKAFRLMEQEYALKLHLQEQELRHQEEKHRIEMDILLIDKEKKQLELELVKRKKGS